MGLDPLYRITVNCLCCESSFQTSRVRMSFKKAVHTDSDFCAHYRSVNPDYYVVRVCPRCGFAFSENFNTKLTKEKKERFNEQIGRKRTTHRDYGGERSREEALQCYKLGLLSAQVIGEKDRIIAGLLHHIAWIYRYDRNEEQEKRFLQHALDAYTRVYETELDAINNAKLLYMLGELNRRLQHDQEAVQWFSRVVHDKSIMDAAMIRASREQWQLLRAERGETAAEVDAKLNG